MLYGYISFHRVVTYTLYTQLKKWRHSCGLGPLMGMERKTHSSYWLCRNCTLVWSRIWYSVYTQKGRDTSAVSKSDSHCKAIIWILFFVVLHQIMQQHLPNIACVLKNKKVFFLIVLYTFKQHLIMCCTGLILKIHYGGKTWIWKTQLS